MDRVGSVHPDKGGSAEDFAQLRQAYEALLIFAKENELIQESTHGKGSQDTEDSCLHYGEPKAVKLPRTADQATEEAYWQLQTDTAAASREEGQRALEAGLLAHGLCMCRTELVTVRNR